MKSVVDLRHLVTWHHSSFIREYKKSGTTPKQHDLLRMSDQVAKLGPLINHWAMRFEAKRDHLKASLGKAFKKSLSTKLQKWIYGQMLSQVGGPTENLFKGDYVVPGQEISVNHVHPMKKDVLQKITFLSNCTVSLTKINNTRMHIQTGLSGYHGIWWWCVPHIWIGWWHICKRQWKNVCLGRKLRSQVSLKPWGLTKSKQVTISHACNMQNYIWNCPSMCIFTLQGHVS